MKTRKIDDSLLLDLIAAGKSQQDCAKFFGVSAPAICKRLKRLIPPPLPDSFNQLTEKQQGFVMEIVKGTPRIDAAMNSFDCTTRDSAKTLQHRLMKDSGIQQAITDLMDTEGFTLQHKVKRMKHFSDAPDGNIALKAIDMGLKLRNSYPPQKNLNLNANLDITDYTEADLEAFKG